MDSLSAYIYKNDKIINLVMALLAFFAIISALIMQYVFELEPCPLCIIQRVIIVLLGVIFIFDYFCKKKLAVKITNSVLLIFFASLGVAVAGRHIWLQHLPEGQIPECMPSLDYLLNTFSIFEVVAKVFKGSAECAEVSWRFLGLSIPEQALILLILFLVASLAKFSSNINIQKR